MNFKNNKGITLVALIITLIIMAILAAVGMGAIFHNGVAERASQAGKDYENAAENESDKVGGLGGALGTYLGDNDPGPDADPNSSNPAVVDTSVNFADLFNAGTYDWDDMADIAKIISSRYGVPGTEGAGEDPKVDRTTEEVIIKNFKNSGTDIKLTTKGTNEYNLVGKIMVNSEEVDYTYKVRIIGFNTDVLSSDQYGEGYVAGTTRAGITFQFIHTFRWDGVTDKGAMVESGNYEGWGASKARADMNASSTINRLPSIASHIKSVNKLYLTTNTAKATSVSSDKLWFLSASEVYPYEGATPYDETTTYKYGKTFDAESEVDASYNGQYIWYKKNVNRSSGSESAITANLKKQSSFTDAENDYGSGSGAAWFLRSSNATAVGNSTFVSSGDGGVVSRLAYQSFYVSPAFCL